MHLNFNWWVPPFLNSTFEVGRCFFAWQFSFHQKILYLVVANVFFRTRFGYLFFLSLTSQLTHLVISLGQDERRRAAAKGCVMHQAAGGGPHKHSKARPSISTASHFRASVALHPSRTREFKTDLFKRARLYVHHNYPFPMRSVLLSSVTLYDSKCF